MPNKIIAGITRLISKIVLTETGIDKYPYKGRDIKWAKRFESELNKIAPTPLKLEDWDYDKVLSAKLKTTVYSLEYANVGTSLKLLFRDADFGYVCIGFILRPVGSPDKSTTMMEFENNKSLLKEISREFQLQEYEAAKQTVNIGKFAEVQIIDYWQRPKSKEVQRALDTFAKKIGCTMYQLDSRTETQNGEKYEYGTILLVRVESVASDSDATHMAREDFAKVRKFAKSVNDREILEDADFYGVAPVIYSQRSAKFMDAVQSKRIKVYDSVVRLDGGRTITESLMNKILK